MNTIRWGMIGCGQVDELNGEGRCPSRGESALRTARVMDAIVGEFRERMRARQS